MLAGDRNSTPLTKLIYSRFTAAGTLFVVAVIYFFANELDTVSLALFMVEFEKILIDSDIPLIRLYFPRIKFELFCHQSRSNIILSLKGLKHPSNFTRTA